MSKGNDEVFKQSAESMYNKHIKYLNSVAQECKLIQVS